MKLFGFGKDKKEEKGAATKKQAKGGAAKEKKEMTPEPTKTPGSAEPKKAAPTKKKSAVKHTSPVTEDISRVLLRPRITEKATIGIEKGAYVFDVAPGSNKVQIAQAIREVYSVTPKKVHITKIMSKNVKSMRTGISGVKPGGKKAYVYLKKGDTISIM